MNKSHPKVSVVCAWYNRVSYIHDTIDSLLAQDYPNFDITVVNDGSPDPRVQEFFDAYDDARLRVIHQDNTGFTRALRRAIDESDGEYIAIQGAGDVSLPRRLSAQVEYLADVPKVVAVGTGHYEGRPRKSRRRVVSPITIATEKILMRRVPFTHGTVVYKRSAYIDAGGYDPFFKFSQDWDLYFRLSKQGEVHGINSPLYIKLLFEDGASISPDKKIEQICFARIANKTVPRSYYFPNSETDNVSITRKERVLFSAKSAFYFARSKEFRIAIKWIVHLLREALIGPKTR